MRKILSEIEYCSRVRCVGVKLKEAEADIIIKELYAHDQAQRDISKELAIFKRALEKACKHFADIKAACPSDAGFDMVKVEKCEFTVTCDGIADECYKLYFIEEAKGESE